MGAFLHDAQPRIPETRRHVGIAIYGRSSYLDFAAGFFLRGFFGVSGSPMAASTTDRASASGSVGFFLGFFVVAFAGLAFDLGMLA